MSRIERLLSSMTLSEKLGQLTMTACGYAVTGPTIAGDSTAAIKSGAIGNLLNLVGAEDVHAMQRLAVEESRLGIPLLIGYDVIHGHRTVFPIPLAEAGLFDPAAWTATARESAKEAAADGLALTFAPMLDVSRDPRWGRSAEGPGEDPWLGTRIAAAKVRGFQDDDLSRGEAIAACAKHYCAYGPVTAGREYASVDISERTVLEVHLPPFAAAVRAGVATVMPAFTDLAGVPMTANAAMLQGWLRGKLGFDGVIISDYNAVAELINHGIAADKPAAAALALKAGVDIDMMADAYRHGLPIALERGLVTMHDIDASVRRVLVLKERLGLFDDPYRRGTHAEDDAARAGRRQLAREIGVRSIVMLKNTGPALPLAPGIKRIGVIGPLSDASAEMRGPWWGAAGASGQVTVLEGLRAAFPGAQIAHALGVPIAADDVAGMSTALQCCDGADAVILCVGEAATMSGEAASRAHLGLPGVQRTLCELVLARNRQLRIPTIVVLFSGRPLVVTWLIEAADAVLAAWFPGSEAGNSIGDLLSGRASPSGRTAVSWPRAAGQVPIYFGERPTGRPASASDHFTSKYLDVANDPLFPFGFGLTYGKFEIGNLQVTPLTASKSQTIEARIDVANVGDREGEHTLFLFTHDVLASVSRPLLELRAFGKIRLQPGAQGTLTLSFDASQLSFLGLQLQPTFEPGDVEILVGPCADRAQLLRSVVHLI